MSLDLDRSKWDHVALGDVVANVNETLHDPESEGVDRVIAMEHMDRGELKVGRWGSLEDGTTFTRRVKPGQTLFGKRRAYQRKVAYADFDAICSGDILTFEADPARMLPDFLPFLAQSDPFFDHALGTSAGSLSPRTNWRDLATFEFDLPPLDEQKRIVDLLWALEIHTHAAQMKVGRLWSAHDISRLALLTVGPNGAWKDVSVRDGTVDHWTEQLPSGWRAETIGSIGTVRAGATPNRSQQALYFDGGTTPWVKSLDLNEGMVTSTDELITPAAVAATSAKVRPAGTVLVAMYGGFVQIGRTAMLGVDAATNQAVSGVLDLRSDVRPKYLHEVLKAGRRKWRTVAASSRKDPNITKKDIEAFDFPLPPIAEQDDTLAILNSLACAAVSCEEELETLRRLLTSLSADIFGNN